MTSKTSNQIDALSAAGEFLLCAIRALAHGAPVDSEDVSRPIEWAMSKISEAQTGE